MLYPVLLEGGSLDGVLSDMRFVDGYNGVVVPLAIELHLLRIPKPMRQEYSEIC
jgi:hypothetical protein